MEISMSHMKNFGFTLAEVLITLGIIGIVAAITLPSLMVQNRERENATKLKKVYSTATQAYTRVVTERGTPEFWDLKGKDDPDGAETLKNLIEPYFKVTPESIQGTVFVNTNTMFLDRTAGPNLSTLQSLSSFNVVDGMALGFIVEDKDCKAVFGESTALKNVCATMIVDVNGSTRPNMFGFDIFKFYITKFGLQPYGTQADETYPFDTACNNGGTGYGCTAWVIFRGNMDYNHCKDLSWTGKSRCKGLDNLKYNNSGL